jgi:mono/diheme cytochrome c family protein
MIHISKIIVIMMFFPFLSFAGEIEEGEAIYKVNCTPCHGMKGEGNGPKAEELKIKPQDHTNASYMSTRTDKQLEYVIQNGGISISKSPLMPAWKGTLPDNQIKAVVKYLRKLCSCVFDSILSDPKLRKIDREFRE